MSTEKRILTASLLSAAVMLLYSSHVKPRSKTTAEQPIHQPDITEAISVYPDQDEDVMFIDSPNVQAEVGKVSAAVRKVILKDHKNIDTGEPLSFGINYPVIQLLIDGKPVNAISHNSQVNVASLDVVSNAGKHYNISYTMKLDAPVVVIDVTSLGQDSQSITLGMLSTWNKGDQLANRYNQLELVALTKKESPFQREYLHYLRSSKARTVPRGTQFVTLTDRYFCQSVRTGTQSTVTVLPSVGETIAAQITFGEISKGSFNAEVYVGTRDYFELTKAGFKSAFKVGVLGKIGLAMLVFLNWIAKITRNYGIAIILFSIFITSLLSPFTLLSFRSMKKMQQLKPQMDKIMAQHKGDTQKANAEVMRLYREQKVSPLSGCLPMLLQFPVLIALFQAITHFIELRGKSFFWINDLSLPDRVATLPFALPILGHDINLLPMIMAVVMYFQSKRSQQQVSSSEANPMASIMSGPLMSVMFGIMFYQFPSGLVLYWLSNSLSTLVLYSIAK